MWSEGRQGGGYLKLKLLESKLFKFDLYLLKFPSGSVVHDHIDPSQEGYEHHRLNIILKKVNPKKGGVFYTYLPNGLKQRWKVRMVKFRPDITKHGMTQIAPDDWSLWLTIGWLKRKK